MFNDRSPRRRSFWQRFIDWYTDKSHTQRIIFEETVMNELQDLIAEVAATRGVEQSVVTLLDALAAKIDVLIANGSDATQLAQLRDMLTTGRNDLAAAAARDARPDAPPANQPPVATDVSATTPVNTAVVIALAATDAENDPLTFRVTAQPANGTLSAVDADGNVGYTPNTDFTGSDSFTYVANDGHADSNGATVTIAVS